MYINNYVLVVLSPTSDGSSSSRAPLTGIVPLFSEETVGYDPALKASSSTRNKKKTTQLIAGKENYNVGYSVQSVSQKPVLTKLESNRHTFEKRHNTLDSSQSNRKCKKRRNS